MSKSQFYIASKEKNKNVAILMDSIIKIVKRNNLFYSQSVYK